MRLRAAFIAIATLAVLVVPVGSAGATHGGGPCYSKAITIDLGDTPDAQGTAADDVIVGTAGHDTINGLGGNDTICGGGGNDIINGGTGDDAIFGDDGNDIIMGGVDAADCEQDDACGNDLLVGLRGSDELTGGLGRDTTYYYDAPAPAAPGGFAVDLNLSNGEAFIGSDTDQLAGIEDVYGSPYNDKLIGDGENNYLDGDPGDDTVQGEDGDDIVIGDNPMGPPGNDTLDGGAGNDHLWGHGGADDMRDPSGTNRFAGDAGNDTIEGGDGFDYVDYFCLAPAGTFCNGGVTTGQEVDLGAATSRPVESDGNNANDHGTDTLLGVIEGVRGTEFGDVMRGRDNVNNESFGDYFWPEAGNDIVDGRGGTDYVDYDVAADDPNLDCSLPVVDQPGLTVTLESDGTAGDSAPEVIGGTYLGNDQLGGIEHAIGSPRSDTMTGTAAANDLWGGCGDDVISGAGGNDGLNGDDQDDVVNGDSGDDKLIGGRGDDALHGGEAGQDIVSYDGTAGGVQVHLGAGTASGDGEDGITSAEVVVGSPDDDMLVGGPLRDILISGGGADELWGRGGNDVLLGNGTLAPNDGADRLYGGAGTDTADYSRAAGPVVVDLAMQTGKEGSTTDHVEAIEVVQGSPKGDALRGDAAANLLLGGGGWDTLAGRGGNDYLEGGAGRDALNGGSGASDAVDFGYGSATRVVVDLAAGTATVDGQQTDAVSAAEIIAGSGAADDLRGSATTDYLAGGGGNDSVYGRGGADSLFGGDGSDALFGGAGSPDTCYTKSGERTVCERVRTAAPAWHVRIVRPRTFRTSGADTLLDDLDKILEDLRRLHRRRLHR